MGRICNASAIVEKTHAGQDWKKSLSHLIQRQKKIVFPLKAPLLVKVWNRASYGVLYLPRPGRDKRTSPSYFHPRARESLLCPDYIVVPSSPNKTQQKQKQTELTAGSQEMSEVGIQVSREFAYFRHTLGTLFPFK